MDNVTAAQSELEAALKQRDELLVALCRVIATHDYHAAKAKAESDFARAIIAKVTG